MSHVGDVQAEALRIADQLDQVELRHVSHRAVPLSELGCYPIATHSRSCWTWLRASGELLLFAAADSWLFLWIVDVDKAEAHTRVAWSFNYERRRRGYQVCVHGDTMWVNLREHVAEISCDDWEVRSCRCLRDFLPDDVIIEKALLVPGTPYLWVVTSRHDATVVVDVESWRLHRYVHSNADGLLTLVTGPEPLVGLTVPAGRGGRCDPSRYKSALYRPEGTKCSGELPMNRLLYAMALTPHGPGLMSLDLDDHPDEEIDAQVLTLRHAASDESGEFRLDRDARLGV